MKRMRYDKPGLPITQLSADSKLPSTAAPTTSNEAKADDLPSFRE